jgi:hypothetical protein
MTGALIISIGTVIAGDDKFWETVVTVAEDIAAVGAATGGVLIAIEGTIVGVTKLIIERTKERAHAQGVKQGRQQERQYVERILKEQGIQVTLPHDEDQQETKGR